MISEATFATTYTSFWRSVLPNSERLVRRLNMSPLSYAAPISSISSPERRAFVNEAAFRLFAAAQPSLKRTGLLTRKAIFQNVRSYLLKFEALNDELLADPSREELDEIERLADSIHNLIGATADSTEAIVVSPKFRGCGFIDSCFGDLIIGNRLWEIKAGDRSFRATDIRQILTYCALNSVDQTYEIKEVGCVNPRLGIFFVLNIDTLSIEAASKSAAELLSEIVYFISSGDISR